jgi:hypothetical protein
MKPGYQIRPRLRFLLDPDQINVAHRNLNQAEGRFSVPLYADGLP